MGANTTAETLALLKVAQSQPDDIIKTFAAPGSATTGLQAYFNSMQMVYTRGSV